MADWIEEEQAPGWHEKYRIDAVLFDKQSKYQHVQVIQNAFFKKMLLLDGIVNTTEIDHGTYDRMLAKPILLQNPKRVAVVGGGDGYVLQELLKSRGLEEILLLEIDPVVIEAARAHLGTGKHFDDPRVKVIIGDAFEYLKDHRGEFDGIVVDLCEEILSEEVAQSKPADFGASNRYLDFEVGAGESRVLSLISGALKPGGVASFEFDWVWRKKRLRETTALMQNYFPKVWNKKKWFVSYNMYVFLYGQK